MENSQNAALLSALKDIRTMASEIVCRDPSKWREDTYRIIDLTATLSWINDCARDALQNAAPVAAPVAFDNPEHDARFAEENPVPGQCPDCLGLGYAGHDLRNIVIHCQRCNGTGVTVA